MDQASPTIWLSRHCHKAPNCTSKFMQVCRFQSSWDYLDSFSFSFSSLYFKKCCYLQKEREEKWGVVITNLLVWSFVSTHYKEGGVLSCSFSRLRIALSAAHTFDDLRKFVSALSNCVNLQEIGFHCTSYSAKMWCYISFGNLHRFSHSALWLRGCMTRSYQLFLRWVQLESSPIFIWLNTFPPWGVRKKKACYSWMLPIVILKTNLPTLITII